MRVVTQSVENNALIHSQDSLSICCVHFVFVEALTSGQTPASSQTKLIECRAVSESTAD